MRHRIFILATLAALAAHAVQMASQPWVTNRIAEAVAAIPAARADLTPATNYTDAAVSSATNNLRAKTDMAVYGLQNVWECESIQPPIFMFGGAAETGYPNTWTNGVGWKLAWGGDMWMLWDADSGSSPNWTTGGSLDAQTIMFWGDDPSQNFTRTEIVAPSDDRLATTGGVAVAIASAVPAGVVTTNENGEVPSLTVASLQSAMPSFGAMYASSADITTFLTVGGTNVMDAIAECARAEDISTNNPAFVAAVTNCPVVLTIGGNVDYGDFGQYGTVGALLAALAAAVVALRNAKVTTISAQSTDAQYPSAKCVWDALAAKQAKYPFVAATVANGALTLQNAAIQTWTPSAGASVTVGAEAYVTGAPARDMVLVIDCSSLTEGDEPTVTWGVNFHPRTDAGTDFACAAGVRNVYYISEYATGEFVVGGWQETEGGNA